eukprot:1162106-Pelagomonas_calceolata.AAC.6
MKEKPACGCATPIVGYLEDHILLDCCHPRWRLRSMQLQSCLTAIQCLVIWRITFCMLVSSKTESDMIKECAACNSTAAMIATRFLESVEAQDLQHATHAGHTWHAAASEIWSKSFRIQTVLGGGRGAGGEGLVVRSVVCTVRADL